MIPAPIPAMLKYFQARIDRIKLPSQRGLRRRRGFALLDLALAVSISAILAAGAIPLIRYQVSKTLSRAEIASVATLADAGLSYSKNQVFSTFMTSIRAITSGKPRDALKITEANLRNGGFLSATAYNRAGSGRNMEIYAHAISNDQILLITRAYGEFPADARLILEGSFSAGRIGVVEFSSNKYWVRGPGVEWDATTFRSNISNALGTSNAWPNEGELIALRFIDRRTTSDLYLHRRDVGNATLNTMETDLRVNGDITSGGTVTATGFTGNTASVGSLTVRTGGVTASTLSVTGTATATNLTVSSAATLNGLTTRNLTFSGNLSIGGSATFSGGIEAAQVRADTINASEITATRATVNEFLAASATFRGDLFVGQTLTVSGRITTSSCTGC